MPVLKTDWNKRLKSKPARIALHAIFWMFVAGFNYLLFSWNNTNRAATLMISGGLLPIAIAAAYFFNYILVPRYLWAKRYGRFILFSVYTFLASTWASFLIILAILIYFSTKYSFIEPSVLHPELQVITLNFIVFLAIAIKQVKRSFLFQQEKSDIENARLATNLKLKEAELKLLKAQIHPHFLFNTLNNLYGLALEKSEDAPALVLRLSEILDYILYRCDEKHVPLTDEFGNIKNYIEIEKIRYSDRLRLDLSFPKKTEKFRIAPLILLPFVENAFKHGVSTSTGICVISLSAEIEVKSLLFTIYNTKPANEGRYEKPGVGLLNVKKRLDLLYPGRYDLKIANGKNDFSVKLMIELDE